MPAELLAEPLARLLAEPLARPLAEPLAEPLARPLAEPLARPLAQPLAEPLARPLAEPLARLLAGPLARPLARAELPAKPLRKPPAKAPTKLAATPRQQQQIAIEIRLGTVEESELARHIDEPNGWDVEKLWKGLSFEEEEAIMAEMEATTTDPWEEYEAALEAEAEYEPCNGTALGRAGTAIVGVEALYSLQRLILGIPREVPSAGDRADPSLIVPPRKKTLPQAGNSGGDLYSRRRSWSNFSG